MPENIYRSFKKFLQDWREQMITEMQKFWGKISIADIVHNTFEEYLDILKLNFNALKRGNFTAEQVKENFEELEKIFKKNINQLTKEINKIKENQTSKLLKEK